MCNKYLSNPNEVDPVASDPVHAVGIGPGAPSFRTRRVEARLADADAVVGFESVIDRVRDVAGGDLLSCGYDDEADTLGTFADRVAAGAAGASVHMGDPAFSGYAFLRKVEDAVDRPVRVVPGISAVQVAANRARTPMEASTFVTLHRRGDLDADLARLARDAGERHLLVIPRPGDWPPPRIADRLLGAGADPALDATVFERLTHDDEATAGTTLGDLAGTDGFSDLSILVVRGAP
ncbi:MAG: cobalt-precorrin-7 (C(5))-methyltransferase [Halobacteriales archaeon]